MYLVDNRHLKIMLELALSKLDKKLDKLPFKYQILVLGPLVLLQIVMMVMIVRILPVTLRRSLEELFFIINNIYF